MEKNYREGDEKMKQLRKAVIPAAGLGTRFLPATKAVAKELLPVADRPTIQYIVEEAEASGITEILIITSPGKTSIRDYFSPSPELEARVKEREAEILRSIRPKASIQFVVQETARGLGDAVHHAKEFCGDEPFAVLLGDNIIHSEEKPGLLQLAEIYERFDGCSVLGVQPVAPEEVSRYGIVSGKRISESLMEVTGMVEKPEVGKAPSNLAILGRYILTPAIFDCLERIEPGYGGELQLTDAIRLLAEREKVVASIYEGITYDIGEKLGMMKAATEFALRDPEIAEAFRSFLIQTVRK